MPFSEIILTKIFATKSVIVQVTYRDVNTDVVCVKHLIDDVELFHISHFLQGSIHDKLTQLHAQTNIEASGSIYLHFDTLLDAIPLTNNFVNVAVCAYKLQKVF